MSIDLKIDLYTGIKRNVRTMPSKSSFQDMPSLAVYVRIFLCLVSLCKQYLSEYSFDSAAMTTQSVKSFDPVCFVVVLQNGSTEAAANPTLAK